MANSHQKQQLKDDQLQLAHQIQEMADIPQDEWAAEHDERWESLNKDYDQKGSELEALIQSEQAAAARADRLQAVQDGMQRVREFRDLSPSSRLEVAETRQESLEEQRALALQGYLRADAGMDLRPEHRAAMDQQRWDPNNRGGFDVRWRAPGDNVRGYRAWSTKGGYIRNHLESDLERRDLGTGVAPDAGPTIPQGFQRELERALLDFGGLRRVSRVWATAGYNPIPWPTTNDTDNKAAIVAEGNDIGSSVDPAFSSVTFTTFKYGSIVIATQELLEDSAFNMSAILGSMLGERLGRGTAEHYVSGNGTTQPEGIVTNAPVAITAASATAITMDEIIDAIHSIDPAYRRFGSFGMVFNDNMLQALRKLKDSQGRYLWEPSLQVGEPDRIFGVPYVIDQDMADMAINAKTIVIGALEKFVIRDHVSIRLYTLQEKYRHLDSTGFMIYFRTDSHPIDAGTEPIKVVQMAAA